MKLSTAGQPTSNVSAASSGTTQMPKTASTLPKKCSRLPANVGPSRFESSRIRGAAKVFRTASTKIAVATAFAGSSAMRCNSTSSSATPSLAG